MIFLPGDDGVGALWNVGVWLITRWRSSGLPAEAAPVSKAQNAAIDNKSLLASKVDISTSVAFQLNPENGCDSVSVGERK
jgi:hypothetical protein